MEDLLASFQSRDPVQIDCELNLRMLYRTGREREDFEERFHDFIDCDADAVLIYELDKHRLRYRSENLIPDKKDGKTPILLILGNPASHSITSGMFFSSRKDEPENRFWAHLLGWAGIKGPTFDKSESSEERSRIRKERLLSGDYDSNFRVGLCVYISMPSCSCLGGRS